MADTQSDVAANREIQKNKQRRNTNNYSLKKRTVTKLSRQENDIYFTNKSSYQFQRQKCIKILEPGDKDVVLHALGASITRCLNLALDIREYYSGTSEFEVNTSTVNLTDDLEPLTDELDFATQKRQNSAVHIRIYRTGSIVQR